MNRVVDEKFSLEQKEIIRNGLKNCLSYVFTLWRYLGWKSICIVIYYVRKELTFTKRYVTPSSCDISAKKASLKKFKPSPKGFRLTDT